MATENKKRYYVVVGGRNPGVYKNRENAEREVARDSSVKLQEFPKKGMARKFFSANRTSGPKKPAKQKTTKKKASKQKTPKPKAIDKPQTPKPQAKPVKKRPIPPAPCPPRLDDDAVRLKYKISSKAKIIYTDGSSIGQNEKAVSAGAGVYFADNDPRNLSIRVPGVDQSSGCAELFAVFKALETIHLNHSTKERNIIIASDYLSGVEELSKRSGSGKRKLFQRYKELFERMMALVRELAESEDKIQITFQYVPGHKGILGNMAADRLARDGAKRPQTDEMSWEDNLGI